MERGILVPLWKCARMLSGIKPTEDEITWIRGISSHTVKSHLCDDHQWSHCAIIIVTALLPGDHQSENLNCNPKHIHVHQESSMCIADVLMHWCADASLGVSPLTSYHMWAPLNGTGIFWCAKGCVSPSRAAHFKYRGVTSIGINGIYSHINKVRTPLLSFSHYFLLPPWVLLVANLISPVPKLHPLPLLLYLVN